MSAPHRPHSKDATFVRFIEDVFGSSSTQNPWIFAPFATRMLDPPEPTNKPSLAHSVLALEELFKLIFGFLRKRDAAKLLCLSHSMFASAAPMIWEDVDVRHVLFLIPGAKRLDAVEGDRTPRCVFELPATMDLTRFELYAPFVRRIHTTAPYTINLPDQWKESGQTPPTPLLPNLLHLGFYTRGPICHEEVEWTSLLLGPKLRSLEAFASQYGSDRRVEGDACCELVAKVSEVCPSLEKLCVYSPRDCLVPLSGLDHLRSFTINEHGINNGLLQALGRLPRLERLAAFPDGLGSPVLENEDRIELPDDSFPLLRELSLDDISPYSIARICTSPRVFRDLIIANISYNHDKCIEYEGRIERLNTAASSLGRTSPHITHLIIDLNGWFAPSRAVIEAFKHMPLRYLNLWYVMLGSEEDLARQGEQVPPGYSPTTEWRDFLAAVPLLEELYLRGQALKPNELPIFACMLPRLKLLVIRTIPFTGTEGVPDAADWRLAAQAITIQLEWYKMTADVSSITRYVYHIWPNVTFKTQFWAHTARMNEALRLLRLKDV